MKERRGAERFYGNLSRRRISSPATTPITTPAMKPPPMNRLTMAAGNTISAARTLNPKKSITKAPSITRPSTTPSMKPKAPRLATHGKNATQAVKKTGESSATPFKKMRNAAVPSRASGNHQKRIKNGAFGNGPIHVPPGGTIAYAPRDAPGMGAAAGTGPRTVE
jgi:hypothetical protein